MTSQPIRALFCGAVLQNFFDLPGAEIPTVLKATGRLLRTIREMPGVNGRNLAQWLALDFLYPC